MNDFSILLYFFCFAVISGGTFAFMWRMMTITLDEVRRPIRKIDYEVTTEIKAGQLAWAVLSKAEEKKD